MNVPAQWLSAAWVGNAILRVSVGLSMVLVGISQYRDFGPFVANVTDGLGAISFLGYLWAFLLPALLIFGGGLLLWGHFRFIAAWLGGIAIGSVPLGLLLKTIMSGIPLPVMLDAIYPMFIWMIIFSLALNPFPDMEAGPVPDQGGTAEP